MQYDGKIKVQKEEVSAYEWVSPSEIKSLLATRKFAKNAVRLYGQFESLGMFPDEWALFKLICEQSINLDPWVKKRGLKGYVEEISLEAKELEKAVHNNDAQNTKEELGDVLHDWMHACILAGKKHGFTFDDVLKEINAKMGRRKPYLKAGKKVTLLEAKAIWEKVKAEERA
jgi:NTP pyrophosphatase (non-canonical NTP hydrolase)